MQDILNECTKVLERERFCILICILSFIVSIILSYLLYCNEQERSLRAQLLLVIDVCSSCVQFAQLPFRYISILLFS